MRGLLFCKVGRCINFPRRGKGYHIDRRNRCFSAVLAAAILTAVTVPKPLC